MTVANASAVNSGSTKARRRLISAGGSSGDDRLEHLAQRLVQPAQQGGAEAAGQRGARGGHELADPRQAEAVQACHGLVGQPQGADRQWRQGSRGAAGGTMMACAPSPCRLGAWRCSNSTAACGEGYGGRVWGTKASCREPLAPPLVRYRGPCPQGEGENFLNFLAMPGHGVRGTRGVGDRRARGEPGQLQPADQVGEQRRLPAGQMRGAGGVDPHPVRRIGRGQRRIAQAPGRKPAERRGVRVRLGLGHRQAGDARLGLRQRQAGAQAQGARRRVDRGDDAAVPVMRRGHEWRANGRRANGGRASLGRISRRRAHWRRAGRLCGGCSGAADRSASSATRAR